ncbi:protein HEG [Electrophorus electricus]|uniref:protein HEG n=1 Tax=Electrophorus electricus TaxID=8005 RepID=UPI0015CF9099|nr:protein HEG [Electrophorus electricus]
MGNCLEAKVFPGVLRVNRSFVDQMKNSHSQEFHQFAAELSGQLYQALHPLSDYIELKTLNLSSGSVVAVVNSIFEPTSRVLRQAVTTAISAAINSSSSGNILANATYYATSLCNQIPFPCDFSTTQCSDSGIGLTNCTCLPGFIANEYSPRSCIACPPGSRSNNDHTDCTPCPFGYSGFNCNDSSLVALVVVACVLGALLLILLLAILVYGIIRRRNSRRMSYDTCLYPLDEGRSLHSQSFTPFPRASAIPSQPNGAGASVERLDPGTRPVSVWKPPNNVLMRGKTGSYDVIPINLNTFTGESPSRYTYFPEGQENPSFVDVNEQRST